MGVTKNAVVGRAHRLNLPSRENVVTVRGLRPVPKKQIRQIRGVSLADLRDDGCRWIGSDDLYCGQPIMKGRYCDEHAAEAYVEPRSRKAAVYPLRKKWP